MNMKAILALTILTVSLGISSASNGQEITIDAPDGWQKESIQLPPEFATDMTLKGVEELRFSPGMFDKDSDSFFTYAFVFQLESEPELTKKIVEEEFLKYYRGLASSVGSGKDVKLDTDKFSMSVDELETISANSTNPEGLKRYKCQLDWVETFVTNKPQTLNLEIDSWADDETEKNYLFVCVSVKAPEDNEKLWNQLRKIRTGFYESRGEQ